MQLQQIASALKAITHWSWSRFITVLSFVIVIIGIKFVTDWQGLARLLVATLIFVVIASLTNWIERRFFAKQNSPQGESAARRRGPARKR